MTFKELELIEPIQQALSKKGYTEPTAIQQQAIPHLLQGRDLFGCAQTGTGKTAAFALPILQQLYNNRSQNKPGVKALILAPTRELVVQISESFTLYGSQLGLKQAVIVGGVSQSMQVAAVRRGADIIIATPGRLMDLMQQGYIKLNSVEFFVLDEADRMLDMGFIDDIKRVIAKLPAKKQTMFFSATVAPEIKKLADSLLNDPINVSTSPVSSPNANVKQSVYYVGSGDKKALLQHVLTSESINHALVFTRTKRGADKVVKELNKSGISAEAIHGNKSQNARQKALKGFKNRTIRVLVATDIASRGIDVDKLSHVINYELPNEAETYVHRIGRTGRAGEQGTAFSFCDGEEVGYLKDITRLLKKSIDVVSEHPYADARIGARAREGAATHDGRSKSGNNGNRRRTFGPRNNNNNNNNNSRNFTRSSEVNGNSTAAPRRELNGNSNATASRSSDSMPSRFSRHSY
jgi:ATP-dependent RNA helicase RhlE